MSRSNGFRIIAWLALGIINDYAVGLHGQIPGPNAVVLINGQVKLDCNVSNMATTFWIRTTNGDSNDLQIAAGCNITGGDAAYYSTDKMGDNTCSLTIGNATMQLGGVYTCFDGSSSTHRSLVTVIDPVASVIVYNQSELVEGDLLNISCSMNYNGSSPPAPSLRPSPYWKTSPGQNFTNTTYRPSMNTVTVVATVRVQKPTVPIFHCNTIFEVHATGGNATGYNATEPADNLTVGSTKTEMDVLYAPSKPSLISKPAAITNNGVPCGISVLTCSSTGNPAPNYRWYDSADSNVILSTLNTLTMGEINRTYICEAYNTIRNLICNVSGTRTVSGCGSNAQCCKYPRNETTSVTLEDCDNGTLCDCSQGNSELRLICNAKTFPNASYMWSGPDGQVTHSQVYDHVTMNGTYVCTAYFNRTTSNYTGDVIFQSGTDETTVSRCSASISTSPSTTTASVGVASSSTTACTSGDNCDVAIAAAIAVGAILFISLALNIMQLIIMVKNMRTKHDPFKRAGTNRTILSPETLDLSNEPPAQAAYEELTRSNEIHLQPTYDKLTPKPPAPATYQELTHPDEIHLQPPTYEKLTTKPSSYVDDLS